MPILLKILAVFSSLIMLFVLIGGALVTKTGSSLGCGREWPLCEGQLVPSNFNFEMIIEYSHRGVSGLAGITVLILAIWSWRKIGHVRETKFLAITSVLFIIIQALLGAAAVIWPQTPVVLALHFGISLISYAAVFLLMLLIFEVDKKFDADSLKLDQKMRFHIYGVIIYTYIVVYTGALVRHEKAFLACPDFPLCSNESIFSLPSTFIQWVQMGHRFAAFLLFVWIVIATLHAFKHYKNQRVIYWGWILSLTLIILQVISGASVIFSKVHLASTLSHATIITLLFGVLSYLVLLGTRSTRHTQK
ncbi:heme A synthase [Bacillus sp. HMF5848]|uniref:COX15/CtaA family protein n=1 Tax=Bacillus sp. HMF5848 TaxID=2495421 RepID=UPI000F7A7A94|nr:heme A synthase [Bacillus sp. HMF5848]RSK26897.1 heme A synthase [Bacillus sp. HMF5848]